MKKRSNLSLSSQTTSSLVVTQSVAQRRRGLARLGLAWLAMMQVMMFALPGYLRHESGGQDSLDVLDWAIFLMNWASLTLTLPVVLYSAWPIWLGCARAYSLRRVTMDVPVGISMLAAFVPSVLSTFKGSGEVYFDSVTMFVAFLLTARYVERYVSQVDDSVCIQTKLKPAQSSLSDTASAQTSPPRFSNALSTHANRVATVFVSIQLTMAAVVGAIWWMIEPTQAWSVLVSLLVMSCPCALSLAAPVSLAALHRQLAAGEPLPAKAYQALRARTIRVTRQNLYGALAWHVLTMPFAALGWVTPWLAALSMLLSSLAVVLNAWRLYQPWHLAVNRVEGAATQHDPLQT